MATKIKGNWYLGHIVQGDPSPGEPRLGNFDLACLGCSPILPSQFCQFPHQPTQNQAEGGTAKIKDNPTKVPQQMGLPVVQYRVKIYTQVNIHCPLRRRSVRPLPSC